MPLYEYACRACHHEFEALVRSAEAPECPTCHSRELERRLSVFAAHTAGAAPKMAAGPGPCGACGDPRGPGACAIGNS
jgi:putative FmdB family regulatory protein